MKIQIISQPATNNENALGVHLRALLSGEDAGYSNFFAAVAFAKFSGVSRIFNALQQFRERGGNAIVVVGVDHRGTTREGLELLLKAVDKVYIYHDESPERRTFHPKLYVLRAADDDRAVVIVGSGNLTSGGLFANYEVHTRIEIEPSDDPEFAGDKLFYNEIDKLARFYQDTSNACVQELTSEVLALLEPYLCEEYIYAGADGEDGDSTATDTDGDPADTPESDTGALGLFGRSSNLPRPPEPDVTVAGKKHAVSSGPRKSGSSSAQKSQPMVGEPSGFWKVLSAFDVSTTSAPGQIIIPIIYRDAFEPLEQTKPADEGGKGRQWETSFPALFIDGDYELQVDARCIVYEPETGQPRTNTECRFTLHSKPAQQRLNRNDILVFRSSERDGIRFEVERIGQEDPRYAVFYRGDGPRWSQLNYFHLFFDISYDISLEEAFHCQTTYRMICRVLRSSRWRVFTNSTLENFE